MALSQRLDMRQGQSLVLTPQLVQAIKILQLSHLELAAFVEQELERNPLLETDEKDLSSGDQISESQEDHSQYTDHSSDEVAADNAWTALDEQNPSLSTFDTDLENVFPDAEASSPPSSSTEKTQNGDADAFVGYERTSGHTSFDDEEGRDLEASLSATLSLQDHLLAQLDLARLEPVERMIGRYLIDSIAESGYLSEPLETIAARLNITTQRAQAVLTIIHGFEPTGVGARDIAECLSLQLKEKNRLDPAMQTLLFHLDVLAKRDLSTLKRLCCVDDEDLREMIAEIRQLDPKPGRAFGSTPVQVQVPDVIVRMAQDGHWAIELNSATLPRVLVNQNYYARVLRHTRSETDKAYLTDCLSNATWLTKSLEQRAKTILKVASEIVRQQDGFFAFGIDYLRPLTLKTVADAVELHESTVSRVVANKSIACSRGMYDMKYFFNASVPAMNGGSSIAAESVRHKIRQLIVSENPEEPLSDDALVQLLKQQGVDVARRTVAKYREAMNLASSAQRRRVHRAGL